MVATYYAAADLTSGASSMALAAAVNLLLTPQRSAALTINGVLIVEMVGPSTWACTSVVLNLTLCLTYTPLQGC